MKRIYEVRLDGGRSHPKWQSFMDGVTQLNGKSPDFGGVTSVAIIGTHHDRATIEGIVGWRIDGLTIKEITGTNVDTPEYQMYRQLIEDYFLPYGDYPAFED